MALHQRCTQAGAGGNFKVVTKSISHILKNDFKGRGRMFYTCQIIDQGTVVTNKGKVLLR